MENNNNENIVMSRIAFERMQAKDERNDKWRNIIIILLIVLLVASNGMWLWHESLYDYSDETTTIKADDGSNANYIGGNGDITNGGNDNGQKEKENSEKR